MEGEKNGNRPWNTQEIIDNAENWSLAADVALLNTIKKFATNLIRKTDKLYDDINNVLNSLNEVGLKSDISQNEFQSLKNTQFIESRVYDDDETLDSKENEKISDNNSPEKEAEKRVDVSLTSEIRLLDKYYEMVEISISDSEDESEKSFVLKPKDMYEERPLPPLIGTDEWYKNWYLEEEASDADSQKSEEVYSESDSDDNLPKDLMYTSETSSELDFAHHANENRPAANSTLKDSSRKPESVTSSEGSEDPNSVPAKAPMSNKSFAEQLAAKLDNVASREDNIPEEINSKPIQPARTDAFSAGLFSDEPPPLSDSEDKTMKGIFSGGKNLFDEDEDEEDSLFWDNQKNVSPPKTEREENKSQVTTRAGRGAATQSEGDFLPKSSQVSKDLFDSDNSDDDIFAAKKQTNKNNTFLHQHKPIVPLIENEPPAIDDKNTAEQPVKKKPVGGVSVFGNQNIGDILKKRQQHHNREIPEKPSSQNTREDSQPKESPSQKKFSLFDDNEEDLFAKPDTKPKSNKYNLFDDDKNTDNKNISTKVSSSEIVPGKTKILSLFDDEESENEDDIFHVPKNSTDLFSDNLFEESVNKEDGLNAANKTFGRSSLFDDLETTNEAKRNNETETVTNTKNLGLFDDVEIEHEEKLEINEKTEDLSTNKSLGLFDASEGVKHEEKEKLENEKEAKNNESKEENLTSFDDDDEEDVLINKEGEVPERKTKKSGIFEDASDVIKASQKTKKVSLFGDYEEDDDEDLFSNVTRKIDFKLFEEPESTDDLFSIKKEEVKTENIIKTAQIEKTDDYVEVNRKKSFENLHKEEAEDKKVLKVIQEEFSKPEKDIPASILDEVDNAIVEKMFDDRNSHRVEDGGETDYSKNASLFDNNQLKSDGTFDNEKKSQTAKIPPKPPLAEKPRPPPSSAQPQNIEIAPTAAALPLVVQPVVNLFGSTPPPDDEDWDNKSDTFSDIEDFLAYRVEQSSSSRPNLFDNEPPSLTGDESSGIVRDQSNTRSDADDSSSYNPRDSSSRRQSSDIFVEQQSQDSFFVTKNRPDFTNPSQLDIIPEDSKVTAVDVTPSGILDETSSAKQSVQTNSSASSLSDVFEKTNSDGGNNSKPPVPDRKRIAESKNVSGNQNEEKSDRSAKKIASITEMLKNQDQKVPAENKVSPGKLKQNLNINVNALLPGFSQQKIKSLTKTQSLELPEDENKYENADNGSFVSKANSSKDLTRGDLEKTVDLDEPDNIDVLHSITKERVRIPVKRRPSTRRGRQEALRKSAIEDVMPNDISGAVGDFEAPRQKNHAADAPKSIVEVAPVKIHSNMSVLPKTDAKLLDANIESTTIPAKKSENLPESVAEAAPVKIHSKIQKTEPEKKIFSPDKQNSKVNLFGSGNESDDDDDEDLFGSARQKKKVEENPKVKEESSDRKSKVVTKKSLFNDSSSDDDLFAGRASSKRSTKTTEISTKTNEKKMKPVIKKLENVETVEDPLSNLLQ